MSNKFLSTTSAFLLSTSILVADVPKVTVDIAPVHSLVAKIMNGVGKPDLIIPAGASPHEYQLKPSNAKSLEDADIVFWMGEDLTPWLEKGLSSLAQDAAVTSPPGR
ncbi:MAG: metal ABC transporter solute-binding protein, Zn/Mn family [Paracoccaceae bacterium]